MAGHSKWANIRHRKERQDKKKGQAWSKCSKALMAAARTGGPDPDMNLGLRYAIDEAKYANMPKDTIMRAIEKGAGAGQGDNFEELVYEGYGPGGTALIILSLTDNGTRTVNELRGIFKKMGGNLGNSGSVAFMFQTKGQIIIDAGKYDEETVMNTALEAGADDVQAPEDATEDEPGVWTVLTDPASFHEVKTAIETDIEVVEAGIVRLPDNTVEVRGDDARKVINLLDAIEDNEDVQKVYSNADIPADELAKLD